jgi:hypothetical protein
MKWLFLVLALCLTPFPARGADLARLVDAVVSAYGGRPAVKRLEAFRAGGQVEDKMRNETGTVRRDFRAPDRLRVEIAYPPGVEIRILNGTRGWRGDRSGLVAVDGLPKVAMVFQMLRSAVPWVFMHHRVLVEERGTRSEGGAELRLLGIRWSRELDMVFGVDGKTGRVTLVEGTLQSPTGRTTVFQTRYLDFRQVEGVLFPFAEENFAAGVHVATTRISAVVFSPPDLGPFEPGGEER